LKIARELALASGKGRGRKLYILDEPTTGLHLDDVECCAVCSTGSSTPATPCSSSSTISTS